MGNPTALSATTFPQVTLADFDTDTETIQPNNGYAVINITKVGTGYHIKTTYGDTEYYLTQAKINQLALTADEKTATIKYEDSKLKIFVNPTFSTTATCYIQYNNQSTGLCFRGYKSVQQPITLFKEVEETVEPEPEPEPEPIERPEILPDTDKGEVLVHVENIDIIDGSFSNGGKVWTSNITPAFSLTFDDNCQLAISGNDDPVLVCNNGTVTITSADPDYYVSGYLFRALSADGNEITIEYPFEGDLLGPDDYGYCYVEGLEEGTEVYFTAQGSQIAFSDIDVIFAPATQQPEPEPEPEVIPDPSTWTALSRTGWTVSGCSQHNTGDDGGFNDTIDANINTYWHTSWAGSDDSTAPHYLIFDLGEGEHAADGFGYTPRQSNTGNGYVTEYAVYFTNTIDSDVLASTCPANKKQVLDAEAHSNMEAFLTKLTPAVEGTFDFVRVPNGNNYLIGSPNGDVKRERTAAFDKTANGRYCIFYIKAAVGQNDAITCGNCAEFNLYTFRGETPEPEPARHALTAGEGDQLINGVDLTDGTISNGNKTWTSKTTPEFTLTLEGSGEFLTHTDGLLIACGSVVGQHVTVTVASADPAYFVSGYVFDATGNSGDQAVITFGDKTITTDGTTQYAWLDPIEEGTAATFTAGTAVAANAKKPIISNLDVRFSPATQQPEVIPDPSTWTALDRSNWTVSGCSQRDGDGDGMFNDVKDGNADTFWHSNWAQSAYEHATPHFLVFDLGEGEHAYDGFGYLPRQNTNGGNGYCNDYAVYVTNDISGISTAGSYANSYTTDGHSKMNAYMADHTAAAEGTMNYTTANTNRPETRVHFTETKSERYVIFVFKTTANVETYSHANCAEFNLYAFRTEPIPVDHRPAGIAWLDNLAKLTVLYDADAINAAKDAVNALAEDATEEDVMAAAKTLYDNDPAIGKHVRFHSVKTADTEDATYYLGGNDETMHFVHGEDAESDLSAVWAVVGTEIPGAYRLLNYGKQQHAGYDKTANQKQVWDETGEMFEFVVPTDVDGGCTIEETNQLVIIAHNNNTDPEGYIHFGKNGTDESQWMITTWTSGSAGSHWRISLADENTAEVTGTYNSETGIYTIACADSENPFSHNATRHATHTIGLEFQQPISLFAAQSDETETPADVALTDNGDGTFGLDLSEQPKGQYAISIPMGYFATPNGFSAAHTDVITHDYTTSITEINAEAGNTEWYNMQGIRVAAPAKGGVYLRATSAGVEKVLVR